MKKQVIMATVALFALCGCNAKKEMKENSENNAVIENILNRTSVRSYTDSPVEAAAVESMLRAGMAAPSAKNVQPWSFVVVDDRALLERMGEGLPYAKMLAHAPLAIIVCGDSEASALWHLDCAAATQNILLAAESLGLGAVWTAAYPYEDRMEVVSSTLGLPEHIKPLSVIPVGHPQKPHSPKDKWDAAKVKRNKW